MCLGKEVGVVVELSEAQASTFPGADELRLGGDNSGEISMILNNSDDTKILISSRDARTRSLGCMICLNFSKR